MKRKTIEVFTVPEDELFAYWSIIDKLRGGDGWHLLLFGGKIREVELLPNSLGDEIRFTVCSPEVQPAELPGLRANQLEIIEKHRARARRGEIDYVEATDQTSREMDSLGVKDFHLECNNILAAMCEKRGLDIGQKITKVALADDSVEFTMVRDDTGEIKMITKWIIAISWIVGIALIAAVLQTCNT